MSAIPIPASCANRPTTGGRVVPYVSVVLAGGRPVLGSVHRSKAMRCIVGRRCQICGQALGDPIVVLVSDSNLTRRYSPEAALCPPCAAYSQTACPVMAGEVSVYREVDRHAGAACPDPGCECGGWVDADPGSPSTRGQVIGAWWAVWLRDYSVAINDDQIVHGLAWTAGNELRRRPVPGTHRRTEPSSARAA